MRGKFLQSNRGHIKIALTLQETTVASQDLVQGIPREVQKALAGVYNWIIRQRRIRDNKVLLGCLERLDKAKVRIIENFTSNTLTGGQQAVRSCCFRRFTNQGSCFFFPEMLFDRAFKFFVLLFEQRDRLLERFEQKLLSDARAFRMFAITLSDLL